MRSPPVPPAPQTHRRPARPAARPSCLTHSSLRGPFSLPLLSSLPAALGLRHRRVRSEKGSASAPAKRPNDRLRRFGARGRTQPSAYLLVASLRAAVKKHALRTAKSSTIAEISRLSRRVASASTNKYGPSTRASPSTVATTRPTTARTVHSEHPER
jgi:hypothetical protein